jgi:hypothetical protein
MITNGYSCLYKNGILIFGKRNERVYMVKKACDIIEDFEQS